MTDRAKYGELGRHLNALGALRRTIVRVLPRDCPAGSAAVLATLGRHRSVRLSRLADLLSIDVSVTSRHVSQAVEQGWVERTQDPDDRRSWNLSLTAAGHEVLEEISERINVMLADRLDDWTADEIDQLTALMTRLHESFADCRPATTATAVPAGA